jgi:PAS domain S-box-containing protein
MKTTLFDELPALALLEWIPVPVLAFTDDGTIVFTNWSFAHMIGHTPEMVLSLTFDQIFASLPTGTSPIATLRARDRLIVDIPHLDGSTVQTRMSESLVLGGADQLALAAFDDVTEQLWLADRGLPVTLPD